MVVFWLEKLKLNDERVVLIFKVIVFNFSLGNFIGLEIVNFNCNVDFDYVDGLICFICILFFYVNIYVVCVLILFVGE